MESRQGWIRILRAPLAAGLAVLRFFDRLVEDHKLIRRTLVVWAAGLITVVTYDILDVLGKMDELTTPVVSFYLGVTALLTTVIGFYQWARERERADTRRSDEVRKAAHHSSTAGDGDRGPDVPTG